jgi:hypothetical protein
MGALEEQLERVIPRDWAYFVNRQSGPLLALLVMAVLLGGLFLTLSLGRTGGLMLPESRIEELITLSNSAKSDVEKIDFTFRYLSATLEKDTISETLKRLVKDYRTYLIGLPVIVGILSAIVAIFWFYPSNVFAWGDCGESYERTVERRKLLWYAVVLALVIGVLSNLFVLGVASWNPV